MEAIRLGDANIFLKGIVEQRYYDPETGNIIGFDNVATDGAIETSVNLQEITGGDGNPVVGIIPDSTRMTGSYTSAAFSLETRKLITGGKLHYGGVAPVCEAHQLCIKYQRKRRSRCKTGHGQNLRQTG